MVLKQNKDDSTPGSKACSYFPDEHFLALSRLIFSGPSVMGLIHAAIIVFIHVLENSIVIVIF